MNENLIFGVGGMGFVLAILAMITVIIVVIISQALKTARARTASMAEITRDEAYRKLAEESIALQRKISEDLAELRSRVEYMEKMMREVE